MKKQSEAAKTFFIGWILSRSRSGIPLWVGWTKEFRILQKEDDPVRRERLVAIGKDGT